MESHAAPPSGRLFRIYRHLLAPVLRGDPVAAISDDGRLIVLPKAKLVLVEGADHTPEQLVKLGKHHRAAVIALGSGDEVMEDLQVTLVTRSGELHPHLSFCLDAERHVWLVSDDPAAPLWAMIASSGLIYAGDAPFTDDEPLEGLIWAASVVRHAIEERD